MMPIWAFLRASSSCLSSSSIFSSSSLTASASGIDQRRAAGELVLGGQLIDLVFVAQPLDELQQSGGRIATARRRRRTRAFPGRAVALPCIACLKRPSQLRRRLGLARRPFDTPCGPCFWTVSVSYFARIFRFRSSSIASRASRLGPRPAIWLGSRRTARASSSSVSSPAFRRTSACARSPATPDPAAAASALGKLTGSYFWYVWMIPPRRLRLGMRALYASGPEEVPLSPRDHAGECWEHRVDAAAKLRQPAR